jgi:hypothetical protein
MMSKSANILVRYRCSSKVKQPDSRSLLFVEARETTKPYGSGVKALVDPIEQDIKKEDAIE